MTTAANTLGLCENCHHAPECALRGAGGGPVLHCEEHECFRPEEIREIVEEQNRALGGVIAILEKIQSKFGYLPRRALEAVSKETGRSLVDIYGVATFYKSFSLTPRGKHHVSVCLGTACHVRGGAKIAESFERALGVRAGETTADRAFSLETVNCLGACALGPIVVADGRYFSQVKASQVEGILRRVREGQGDAPAGSDRRLIPVEVGCPRCNHSLMDGAHDIDGHPSVRVTASFGRTHGWLRLSGLYGSFAHESEYPVPVDAAVNFFCPHCHGELNGVPPCAECGASMVAMIVRGGGVVQICSRRGCRGHMLDLDGVNF